MATPALIERVTGEDTDNARQLSSHHLEAAFLAMRGGYLTQTQFENQVSASDDDKTDIQALIDLVTGDAAAKNRVTMGIIGIISLAHHDYFNAATARIKLGIDPP